jgi:hypothetical protein
VAYGKKRHCYICKRKEGEREDRAEFKDDPKCKIVRIYPSTPRCVPCQRIFSRRAYHKAKARDLERRNAARQALGMPAVGEGDQDGDAAATA